MKKTSKPDPAKKRPAAKTTAAARSRSQEETAEATAAKKRKRDRVKYENEPRSKKEAYLRRLADLFVTSAKPEIVAARALEDETMFIRIDLDGYEVAISVADVRLIEGSLDTAEVRSKGMRGRYNRIKRPETLTVEQLKERNLPLYWNEQWLRNELDRLGSYSEIARVHGYPSATTIASYGKRKFGIDIQGQFDQKRADVLKDYKTGEYTHLELANKHGVGVATVYRWVAEGQKAGKKASARRGRTPKTPEERERDRLERERKKAEKAAQAAA